MLNKLILNYRNIKNNLLVMLWGHWPALKQIVYRLLNPLWELIADIRCFRMEVAVVLAKINLHLQRGLELTRVLVALNTYKFVKTLKPFAGLIKTSVLFLPVIILVTLFDLVLTVKWLNLLLVCGAVLSFYVIIQTVLIFIWCRTSNIFFKKYFKTFTNLYI